MRRLARRRADPYPPALLVRLPGAAAASVEPAEAFYSPDLREFSLPYDVVRASATPDDTLLRFLQATHDAAARLGHCDRKALERTHAPAQRRAAERRT